MKNLKIKLIGFATLLFIASAIFVSCNKNQKNERDNIVVNDNNEEIDNVNTSNNNSILNTQDDINLILASSYFTEFISTNNFTMPNYDDFVLTTDPNGVKSFLYSEDENKHIQIIKNIFTNEYTVLKIEAYTGENNIQRVKFSSMLGDLTYLDVAIGDIVTPDPLAAGGGPSYPTNYNPNNPCNSQGFGFSDCLKCAWDDMNNNAIGSLTCSTPMVLVCWTACGIHCAIGGYIGGYSNYFTYFATVNNTVNLVN